MKKESVFFQQHTLLKFIVIVIGVIISIMLNENIVRYLILFNILYFLFSPTLVKEWFFSMIKVSSFIFSYLFLALLLDIDFTVQIEFLSRVLYLLQLSVFFTFTTKLSSAVQDCRSFFKYPFFYHFFFFILSLTATLPVLKHCWQAQIARAKKEKQGRRLLSSDYVQIIINSLEDSFYKLPFVEWRTKKILSHESKQTYLITLPNLLLMYQLTVYILAISF